MSRKTSSEILDWINHRIGVAYGRHDSPITLSYLRAIRNTVKKYRSLVRFLEQEYPHALEDWSYARS